MAARDFANQLLPGESIVWRGAPRAGLQFTLLDIPLVIFGLFFTGISLLFVTSLFPFGLLLPHFWVGLYFVFGRFFVERRIRASTSYAVTQSRALIQRTWPTRRSSTVNLDTVSEISLAEHSDGTGTISFGANPSPFMRFQWPGQRGAVPSFDFVDDAPRVMRLLQRPAERRRAGATGVTGDEVRKAGFRDKLRGYHPDDVDARLEKVARELDAGRSPSPLLRNLAFRSKLRGYHPDDVDALIARLGSE